MRWLVFGFALLAFLAATGSVQAGPLGSTYQMTFESLDSGFALLEGHRHPLIPFDGLADPLPADNASGNDLLVVEQLTEGGSEDWIDFHVFNTTGPLFNSLDPAGIAFLFIAGLYWDAGELPSGVSISSVVASFDGAPDRQLLLNAEWLQQFGGQGSESNPLVIGVSVVDTSVIAGATDMTVTLAVSLVPEPEPALLLLVGLSLLFARSRALR
jgi:hypothetical protein